MQLTGAKFNDKIYFKDGYTLMLKWHPYIICGHTWCARMIVETGLTYKQAVATQESFLAKALLNKFKLKNPNIVETCFPL